MKYTVTLTVPDGADTDESALRKLAVQEIARLQKSQPHGKAGSRIQNTSGNQAGKNLQGNGRITEKDISAFVFRKKSLDARRNQIKTVFRYDVYTNGDKPDDAEGAMRPWLDVNGLHQAGRQGGGKSENDGRQEPRQVVIIGDGPAGLFAALRLLEDGIKPVIIERGPEASQRKRDIADISRTGSVHADSNYCFGEGGAGTFSDGKLFSRSNKRGNIDKILQIFAFHGAQASITTDAHPHIGTDRLPAIIGAMNETIRSHGGEVHFNTRCDRLITENNRVTGVSCIDTLTGSRSKYRGKAVILATGHSAPDIYEMIAAANPAALEAKTFAAGVRVEHPRELIDRIQYHGRERGEDLPAAEYRLTTQVDGRGVYSFCMCPGGLVVPSASAPGGVVVNGMSPSSRNARWSNAAIVVELRPEDFSATDPLSGLRFRTQIEQKAYAAAHESASGANPQAAPAQRLVDFLEGRLSSSLPESSYTPGLVSARLDLILPEHISRRLKQAFRDFDRNMHGFICEEALLIAPETRTSTPVRILRDKETRESPILKGLYPAGEGSGYAGGITSSAMDGESAAALVSGLV